jgi:pimeloyl-ACP methyl ester carboxylesterase
MAWLVSAVFPVSNTDAVKYVADIVSYKVTQKIKDHTKRVIIMQKTFQYQDKSISYRIEGKGRPVIFIHGFGEDSHIWDQQVDFLKDHGLLILPDLPGTGQSQMLDSGHLSENNISGQTADSPDQAAVISLEDYARCIQALLRQEKIEQCTLLGHSLGGYITLAFAELFPRLLNGFGLIHSTALADSEEKKNNRRRGIQLMEQYGAYAFFKNSIPNLFGSQFKKTNPEKIQFLAEASKQLYTQACQQYLQAMIDRPERTVVLKNNPLPVLFVIGSEDTAAPMSEVLPQTHLPVCSYVHIMENAGHMGMLEAPEQLNQYLLEFIER